MKNNMLVKVVAQALAAAVVAGASLAAQAQEARAAKWVNLRAGPDRDYPLVARIGPGSPLLVQGCTDGFGWCDVVGPGDVRGWVYAGNIVYPYQSAEVPVLAYGAVIGFPIVGFVIGDYWGRYYRGRPWYGNVGRWEHHRPPPRPVYRPGPPPRPPGHFQPGRPGDHDGRPGFDRPRPPPNGSAPGRPPGAGDARPPRGGPGPSVRPEGGGRPDAGPRPQGTPRPQGGGRSEGGGGRPEGGRGGGGGGGERPGR